MGNGVLRGLAGVLRGSATGSTAMGLLALVLAGCAATAPLPEPADVPFGQGRLWQVDLAGRAPSYLFGTMHDSDRKVLDLPAAVEEAFAEAQIAAFEVVEETEPTAAQRRAYFALPAGHELVDIVGPKNYRELRRVLSARMLSVSAFDGMQPWVVWAYIADREISISRQDPSGESILDDWLQERAEEAGKEVVGLETVEEQLEALGGVPMADQVSMLESGMKEFFGPRTRVDRLQIYLDGNLAQSYALWNRLLGHMEPAVAQRYHARLLTDRNRIMVARMMPLLERGTTFVAVGALHMPGEEGILRLLEQEGFTVTRLE